MRLVLVLPRVSPILTNFQLVACAHAPPPSATACHWPLQVRQAHRQRNLSHWTEGNAALEAVQKSGWAGPFSKGSKPWSHNR